VCDSPVYAALDLGGTNTRAVLFDEGFRRLITVTTRTPARATNNPRAVYKTVVGCLKGLQTAKAEIAPDAELKGIGAAVAGIMEGELVTEATRLPTDEKLGQDRLPTYRAMISETLGPANPALPIKLDNDARCATLYEARYGAGQHDPLVYYVTISSGFGGGVALNRELVENPPPLADEPGRYILHRGRELREGYVSGHAIVQQYWARGGAQDVSEAKEVADLARQGDRMARSAVRRYARFLGYGMAVAMLALVAEYQTIPRVVFGGGVSQAMSLLANGMCSALVTALRGGSRYVPDAVQAALESQRAYLNSRQLPFDEELLRRQFEDARARLRQADIQPEFFARTAMGEWVVAAGAAALLI